MDKLIEQLLVRIKDPIRYIDMAEHLRENERKFGQKIYDYVVKVQPPVTIQQLEAAEQELGYRLPTLLRSIYTQVANGGFGPGYGLLGLPPNGATDDQGENAVSLQLALDDPNEPDEYYWPEKLLPICYFGCGIYACLDCMEESGPIIMWEAGEIEQMPTATSLQEWLENWLIQEN